MGVVWKGVLKVSVEITWMHGEKMSSNQTGTERCAESECAESEPPYTTVTNCNKIYKFKTELVVVIPSVMIHVLNIKV